ncbi:hypothetical protein Leryth_027383 [Lithospermum erythrorhizon]|nr:hypothetical protein Leryth_027383 [Lithospermum erythrorhizon]
MEIIHLLWSILTTCLTALTRSLLLPFRRLVQSRAACQVRLYEGSVWHQRKAPVQHSFQYSVRYALYELDHSPTDHLSASQARLFAGTNGPVFLLSIPPSVGYEQNPLSVYYCYENEGSTLSLKKCIAEVSNSDAHRTWLNVVSEMLFDILSRLPTLHGAKGLQSLGAETHTNIQLYTIYSSRASHPPGACFIVWNPRMFVDMHGNWCIKANAPGDSLAIEISVQHPELGDYFTATLMAKKVSSLMVGDHALFFWLMPHKVALWIYWHALKLWWKGVPFIQHPRYSNPEYREEATRRDRKVRLKSVECIGQNLMGESSSISNEFDTNVKDHCFRWRDAKWPWC